METGAQSEGRILYVEDDPTYLELIPKNLERGGFEVMTAHSVREALSLLDQYGAPDLALLDLGLADDAEGGFRLIIEIRAKDRTVPIVVLSADATDTSKNRAHNFGALDFIVKDSDDAKPAVLIPQLKSWMTFVSSLRKRVTASPDEPVDIGPLHVDYSRYEATLDGEQLMLSHKEFELLRRLIADAGKVVTREQLMADVWDENWFGSTKTLDVHIGWLRRKLGDDPADPKFLFTVRGVGFRFAAPEEVTSA